MARRQGWAFGLAGDVGARRLRFCVPDRSGDVDATLAFLYVRLVVAALTAMVELRLLAAALEPVGDEEMAKLMDAFAAAYALLAAAVTATLALTLILIGATAGLGVRLGG